jgi:hypothetical protein
MESALIPAAKPPDPVSAEAWQLAKRAQALEQAIASMRGVFPVRPGYKARMAALARAELAARRAAHALACLVPLP